MTGISKRRGGVTKSEISVRMYKVGFGDCFLIRIPTVDGERRMLVDCGFHSQGKGDFSDRELVEQIKEHLNGKGLHVVVATHRHQDHISGFGEKDLWADVTVEEVWLPFTANPDSAQDEPALRAWQGLMDAAASICDANGALTPAALAALGSRDAVDQAAVAFMLWNARANEPAIENLLRGFKKADGRPSARRFLPEKGNYPTSFITPVLPDVKVHVLGPPTDPAMRKNKKVPSTWGLDSALAGAPAALFDSPFSEEWRVPAESLPHRRPFVDRSLEAIRLFNDDLLYAARALDGFLNGESLVLVLEIGRARLLLPGDAEVGTWMTILSNPAALDLAASATFVKIGHHGSHNATPLVFVKEHLAENTPAMISTQEGPGKYRNGIPLQDLLSEMGLRHMPFVRSDKPPAAKQSVFVPEKDGHWIDCKIPC
ncbi:MAG: MBL fold metallo-hydrolase [Burkholderiales bacterium]|nr:MBL fold metallo-hydrolase [Burkholderiales bacterium]